jgi:hypothetical protein
MCIKPACSPVMKAVANRDVSTKRQGDMADLDIQKKEGPPILPIILGVLAIAAIIAAVLLFRGDDDDYTDTTAGTQPYDTAAVARTPGVGAAPGTATGTGAFAVQQYQAQCGDAAAFSDEMGQAHQHEADCMRQLADGIDAVVQRETVADQPLRDRVEALKQRADQIRQDPQATDHANRVRGAAMETAEIIEYIARNRQGAGADLQRHATQTRQAAEQIDASTLLLEQRDRTAAFFSRAGNALEAMGRG